MRAYPDDAFEFAFIATRIDTTEDIFDDERATAPTSFVITAEDVAVFPGALDARGYPHWRETIGPHEVSRHIDNVCKIDQARRGGRMNATDKTDLGTVLIADAGQVALIEQGWPDGTVGAGGKPADGFLATTACPVIAEDVGTKVGYLVEIGIHGEYADEAEFVADDLNGTWGGSSVKVQHHARCVTGVFPAIALKMDRPVAFHFQVGVEHL